MERKRFSKEERLKIYNKYQGHCAYCGCKIDIKDMQVDHLLSYERHKEDESINDFANLMPSCRSCNHRKNCFSLETFRTEIEHGLEVLERDSATYRNMVRFGLIEPKPHKIVFYFETVDKEQKDEGI